MANAESKTKFDLYQVVTDKIIAALETGVPPWSKGYAGSQSGVPINAVSGNPYKGINVLLLWIEGVERGFSSDIWLSGKQALDAGCSFKEGEGKKWTLVTFWKWVFKDKDGNTVSEKAIKERKVNESELKKIPFLRYHRVYNLDQFEGEGIESLKARHGVVEHTLDPDELDAMIAAMGVEVRHRAGVIPNYRPTSDLITMPPAVNYDSYKRYMATKAHEAIHATGHASRLNRPLEKYHEDREERAKEELIAEIGSAMFCAQAGIEVEMSTHHASYIASWLKVLRDDNKFVVSASTKAQKACEFLLNSGAQAGSEQGGKVQSAS